MLNSDICLLATILDSIVQIQNISIIVENSS